MQRVVLRFIVIALVSGEFCIAFGAASAAEPKNEMVTLNAKPEPIAIDPARLHFFDESTGEPLR